MPQKLNSMRLLESRGIPYSAKEYDPTRDFHSATDVASLIGAAPETVYKTLIVPRDPSSSGRTLKSGKPIVVMIASNKEVNLKLLAKSLNEKRLRMATQREAELLTGLQVGGISRKPSALLGTYAGRKFCKAMIYESVGFVKSRL